MSEPWSSAGTTRAWGSFEVSAAGRSRCACSTTSTRSPRSRATRPAAVRRRDARRQRRRRPPCCSRRAGDSAWTAGSSTRRATRRWPRSPATASRSGEFRVPTPEWDTRSVGLGQARDLPAGRAARDPDSAHLVRAASSRELDAIERDGPVRHQARDQGRLLPRHEGEGVEGRRPRRAGPARSRRAPALVGPGELMVQELIPGDGRQQFAYCAFFKDGAGVGSMDAQAAASASAGVRPREHLRRDASTSPRSRRSRSGSCARSTTTGWSSWSTSSISRDGRTSCSTSTRAPGAITARPRCRGGLPAICSSGPAGPARRALPRAAGAAMDPAGDRPPDRARSRSEAVTWTGAPTYAH